MTTPTDARDVLTEWVRRCGPSFLDQPRRVRAVLHDAVPSASHQTALLSAALEHGVARRVLDTPPDRLTGELDRLTAELVERRGLTRLDAAWAVGTVAAALGASSGQESPGPGAGHPSSGHPGRPPSPPPGTGTPAGRSVRRKWWLIGAAAPVVLVSVVLGVMRTIPQPDPPPEDVTGTETGSGTGSGTGTGTGSGSDTGTGSGSGSGTGTGSGGGDDPCALLTSSECAIWEELPGDLYAQCSGINPVPPATAGLGCVVPGTYRTGENYSRDLAVYEYADTLDRDAAVQGLGQNPCDTFTIKSTAGAVTDTGTLYCFPDQDGMALLVWTYDSKPYEVWAKGVNQDVEGLVNWFFTIPHP
ncbi:hypothetical protein SAMN06893096_106228 [Geodermatophilus pulveris]|uniref:Uncharacterized protein n=1 Tax=Geodermatophilus pulveris TaxID=1564159 RepID=A0A239GK16_9ACTN|nr:hypothetical protein [Geodermatophilus pulveris]SNS69108.1 hypothetical protein SAMN06893096_106228 [Geodermatophilus pulveris]